MGDGPAGVTATPQYMARTPKKKGFRKRVKFFHKMERKSRHEQQALASVTMFLAANFSDENKSHVNEESESNTFSFHGDALNNEQSERHEEDEAGYLLLKAPRFSWYKFH